MLSGKSLAVWSGFFPWLQPSPTAKGEPPQEKELEKARHQKGRAARQSFCEEFCGKEEVKRNQTETARESHERMDLLAGKEEEREGHGGGAGGDEDSLGRGHRGRVASGRFLNLCLHGVEFGASQRKGEIESTGAGIEAFDARPRAIVRARGGVMKGVMVGVRWLRWL